MMIRSSLLSFLAALFVALASPLMACELPARQKQIHAELTGWVNDLRASKGLRPLRSSAALEKAALAHACDMAVKNFLSHSGSNGSTLQSRLRGVGYGLSTATENVARSSAEASATTAARIWSGSSAHMGNLLNPQITEMGLAITQGGGRSYYVFVGAKPR